MFLRINLSSNNDSTEFVLISLIGNEYAYLPSDDFKNHMLIAVTELRTKDEIDTFVEKAGELND